MFTLYASDTRSMNKRHVNNILSNAQAWGIAHVTANGRTLAIRPISVTQGTFTLSSTDFEYTPSNHRNAMFGVLNFFGM